MYELAGFRRAFEKDSASESVVWHYALSLHVLGRFSEAMAVLQRALELNPHSHQIHGALVDTYLNAGQPEKAVEVYLKLAALQREDAFTHSILGYIYQELGRYDDAVEALLQSLVLSGDSADQVQALRQAYVNDGMLGFWRIRVEHLKA